MSAVKAKTILEQFDAGADVYDANTAGCTIDVAKHTVGLCAGPHSIGPRSVILDNACGSGALAQTILGPWNKNEASPPTIYCADGAPGMVRVAEQKLAKQGFKDNVKYLVTPGEDLSSIADDTFTHSFTIMGIMLFENPQKGAQEIYRTLRPDGIAIVTSWKNWAFMPPVHEAQAKVTPDAPLFDMPIPKVWRDPAHCEAVMRDAGFQHVQVHSFTAHFGASSTEQLCKIILDKPDMFMKGLSQEKVKEFKEAVFQAVDARKVNIVRETGEQLGLPMQAIVAVCMK